MLLGKRAYGSDLIVSPLHRLRAATAKQLRLNPDRKELRIKTACLRAHCVEVAVVELLLNIDVFVKQTLRGVDVHVDRDGTLMYREWIGFGGGDCVLIVLIHLFVTTAGRKR
jgi:hypothetical protein